MRRDSLAALLSSSLLFTTISHADVKPNPLFSDGAVLQRGQIVPVWGTAAEGEEVTVEFQGQKVSAKTQGGKWRVDLKPLQLGEPASMKISGQNTVVLKDLLVGEVWLASGQSNMEWTVSNSDKPQEEIASANFPKIKMLKVPHKFSKQPLDDAPLGLWLEGNPQNVGGFSAVAYSFARDLHARLGVPIGIIHSSWGGTPAQAWTSIEGFAAYPELEHYKKEAEGFLTGSNQAVHNQNSAASLYNQMIQPLIPYGIKGVIWYQGESNAGQAKEYETLFPAMIADWRGRWKQGDFPFCYVQIAPFNGMPPEIREAQLVTLSKVKNSAMAVTTDVGNADDIHPKAKQPVGARLALAARSLAYGEKIVFSGPLFQSVSFEGNKAKISFHHIGSGLMAKDGDLKGFTIAGADAQHVPAKAVIVGSQVIVSADGVTQPKAVRYGWANVPDVNLFNKEGLPASPFRSDIPQASLK
jgi:sialate O-acetylesterase